MKSMFRNLFVKAQTPLAFIGLSFLVALCVAAAPATRDFFVSTLRVYPASIEAGTNHFTVFNKAGTNWFGVEPTNAAVQLYWWGTNYTAVTWTNVIVTNATGARTLVFKNGLLVQVN